MTDVAVVGLGGTGLAAVLEALRRGASVTGYDTGTVGRGATGSNAGFLLAGGAEFYHRLRNRDLYAMTIEEIRRMEEATPAVISREGSIRRPASFDEHEDCEAHYQALRDDGFPAERLDDGSLFLASDGAFHPLARARILATAARDAGARLREHSPVVDLGAVEADRVIVAIDGGLESAVPSLAGRVRTARLQMLATARTDEVRIDRPTYSRWGYDYWQQLPDGRIIAGGCRDQFPEQSWTAATKPTIGVQSALDRLLREEIGVRRAAVTHRWAGSSAFTEDKRPVCEEVRPGLVAIGGFCGHGNVIGSLAGRAAVELALDGKSSLATTLVA
jgi:gamma-glutamylputrescine oxidase